MRDLKGVTTLQQLHGYTESGGGAEIRMPNAEIRRKFEVRKAKSGARFQWFCGSHFFVRSSILAKADSSWVSFSWMVVPRCSIFSERVRKRASILSRTLFNS